MLNSTTNRRLHSNFDAAAARRRSSASSRRSSSIHSANTIVANNDNKLSALNRQVQRIYKEEKDEGSNRILGGKRYSTTGNSTNSLNSLEGNISKTESHMNRSRHTSAPTPPTRQRRKSSLILPSQFSQLGSISRQKLQNSRRKSVRGRYSISNKVHPPMASNNSSNYEATAKDVCTPKVSNTNVPRTALRRESIASSKKQRRGSRLMPSRYSIARKIKKQQNMEQNNGSQPSSIISPENGDHTQLRSSLDRFQSEFHLERRPWFIVSPSNKYRIGWDVFMAWLLASMAFYVPFRVCMYWDDDTSKSSGVFWFELFTDISFGIDILMNFCTAYHDPHTKSLVCSPRRIAARYLSGYFFFDLIATIPFNYILSSSNGTLIANKIGKLGRLPRMVRFLKAIRLLKLLRVYKLKDFITKLETDYGIHHGVTRLIKIISAVVLVTHLAGCFWHLVGLTGGTNELEGGWIYRYSFSEKSITVRYIASLYWSFSTLTTVGYGDISGRTPQEQIYSMLMMLLGVSWYAYIVSSMATIMSTFDATSTAIREKMVCVNEFIRGAKLPHHLGRQVRSFFEFKLTNSQRVFLMNKHYDADEILYELSSSLRAEIMLYMERDLISQIPFFDNKVNQFVADTVSMLQPMIAHEGEFIVKEGSQADEMFFLTKGVASVLYGRKPVLSLEEGSYFGEIGCLVGGIRRASVVAKTTCELQALSRKNLNILVIEYPDVGDELKRVAKDRAKVVKEGNVATEEANLQCDETVNCEEEGGRGSTCFFLTDEIVDANMQEMMASFQLNKPG